MESNVKVTLASGGEYFVRHWNERRPEISFAKSRDDAQRFLTGAPTQLLDMLNRSKGISSFEEVRSGITEFEYVSVESYYRRVTGEEGSYDAHRGYKLHAAVRVPEGHLDHYLHEHVFATQAEADLFAAVVEERGKVVLHHWDFINRDHANRDHEGEDMFLCYLERIGEL